MPHLVRGPDEHIEAFSFVLDKRCSTEEIRGLLEEFRAEFQGEGENQFLSYVAGDPSTFDDSLEEAKLGDSEISYINKEIWALPGSVVVIGTRNGSWSVSIPSSVAFRQFISNSAGYSHLGL